MSKVGDDPGLEKCSDTTELCHRDDLLGEEDHGLLILSKVKRANYTSRTLRYFLYINRKVYYNTSSIVLILRV